MVRGADATRCAPTGPRAGSSSARGDTAAAAAEAQKAIEILQGALKARREAGVGQTDPGLVGNVGDLAIVLTETGKPAEALQLLDPIVKAQTVKSGPAYSRLMEAQLMAFITTNQVQQAIATMKTLEQAGGGAQPDPALFQAGKLLEKELDALEQKGNTAGLRPDAPGLQDVPDDPRREQDRPDLRVAGMGRREPLTLDAYKEAEEVLQRVLKEFTQDPQFLQQPNGAMSLLRTRLKLAAALRGEGKFDEANSLVEELLSQNPKYHRAPVREGHAARSRGRGGQGTWSAALRHWEGLAKQARSGPSPGRLDYYDAWYHVAWVLSQQKETLKARQTLQGVMRLTPSVGGPEMKAKYQALLARLSKK